MILKDKIYIVFIYLIALVIAYFSFNYFNQYVNLLVATLFTDIVCTFIIFIFSMIKNNSSVYDPYWSVIPPLIVFLWMKELNIYNIYALIIIFVYLVWGIRLTLNWFINWQGFSHEDWRYVGFREKTGKFYWLVSLLGIHLFPTLIVFLSLFPIYFGLKIGDINYLILFIFGSFISLFGFIISLIADIHLTKHRKSLIRDKSIKIGIWSYSRHPNYLGELSFWFGSFIIGLSYSLDNYFTAIGITSMILLFNLYSIPVIEKKLKQTKSDYYQVIDNVPRLLPFRIIRK